MAGQRGRAPSVKDVAAAAEVSLGTVSNVLNRPERVSAATRERVARAMAELGFVRNESARSLRTGRSNTLAYVMLDTGNPFFTDVAHGIELATESFGNTLFLCNSDNRADREAALLSHLEERQILGVLITPVDPQSATLTELAARGTPLVIVDRTRDTPDFCSVAVDDVLGGRLALEHLIDQGHRRVAVVGGPLSIGQVADRYAGAQQVWAEAGLPPGDLTLIQGAALTAADGRAAGEQIAGIPARRRPTAAFCANDLIALGLLQHSISQGLAVPGDLAIMGYDDIEFAAAAAVPLTSVRQPRQQLGRTAAELVLDEAGNPDHTHRQVSFTPALVARASTTG
ncbi:MAG: LacI family DNA-binding transcriptional regulator [Nocardioides sp.]|uniref:LacI family DNA-binding transcriptional regulator n=1 Tax=Nocardioides sp. TaxID=35761 RepID=UPI0039E25445